MMVHATTVACRCQGAWLAALLFGPSGSGKSDLALRALALGWKLVSDDYSLLWPSGGSLWARAPDSIADRIEARGLGILTVERLPLVRVGLAVRCEPGPLERLPEPEAMSLLDFTVPCVRLATVEASALAKLERALSTRALPAGAGSAYLGRSQPESPDGPLGAGA